MIFSVQICFLQVLLIIICISHPFESAVLYKSLVNSGFHRHLSYEIQDVPGITCLMIEENLSTDIYIDPYQLANEFKSGLIQINTSEDINVEKPAYEANSLEIKAFSLGHVHKLDFPIHLRYQKPQFCAEFGKKAVINLGPTNLHFTEVDISSNVVCSSVGNISWTHLEKITNEIKIEIPVGCIEHFYLVLGLTVCFVLIKSLMICNQLLRQNIVM